MLVVGGTVESFIPVFIIFILTENPYLKLDIKKKDILNT